MSETAGRTIYHKWQFGDWGYTSDLIAHDYMRRWILRTPWKIYRLHHILRSDADRHFHDHPMDFTSIILWGGYVEHTPNNPPRECRPGDVVHRRAEDLHFLKLRGRSAWTVLIAGKYRRPWGFQTEDGWVEANDYDAYLAKKRASGQPPQVVK